MCCLKAAILVIAITQTCGFRFNCAVSIWSEWSVPYGFGSVLRTRNVVTQPTDCGTPCPKLWQEEHRNEEVSLNSTVKQLCEGFLNTNGVKRDILLFIDGSGSITPENFNLTKILLVKLLGALCPSPTLLENSTHRVAAVVFGDDAKVEFDFDDYPTTTDMLTALANISYPGGATLANKAFHTAHDLFHISRGARMNDESVKKMILLLTDGQPSLPGLALAAATDVKEMYDVYGMVFGTFSPTVEDELRQYFSEPLYQCLYAFDSYVDFEEVVDIVSETCSHC